MWLNVTGTKLLLVSSSSEANAGKEKLVGALENPNGTADAHVPVALLRGFLLLKEKLGTRGRQNPITRATLSQRSAIRDRRNKQDSRRYTYAAQNPKSDQAKTFLVQ
jgi:hypothetical protein